MTKEDRRTIKRKTGDIAEEAVIRSMTKEGYRLICRNFEIHNVGELDCVFEKNGEIYVVEVRSRYNKGCYPSSAETVDYRKRLKIERTSVAFSKKILSLYKIMKFDCFEIAYSL